MQNKQRILIVEDEVAIRAGLVDVFVYHGYDVDFAEDGRAGLDKALTGRFDLIVLDVMMPKLDGFAVCQAIRERDRDQPIIMLTAKSADEDVIQGLALGADDYVSKPFSVAQLVLRVQAVLRRAGRTQSSPSVFRLAADVEIDPRNLSGRLADQTLSFTRREMQILEYLRAHADRPVAREELLERVWGYAADLGIETRTVDIHIAKLRRKVEPDPSTPRFLLTIRGAGYKLLVDPGR